MKLHVPNSLNSSVIRKISSLQRNVTTYFGHYLQEAPQKINFVYNQYGKPSLAIKHSNRLTPLHFNLSHANEIALYAVGLESNIGIDIEYIRKDIDVVAIARRFFSDHENQAMDALTSEEKIKAFFNIWTRKEAFIKALGEGLSFSLKNFDVSYHDSDAKLLSICGDEAAAKDWSLHSLKFENEYVGAVATKGIINELTFLDFHNL